MTWAGDHAEITDLLRRCWRNDAAYDRSHAAANRVQQEPGDAEALSAWVTATVMSSPVPVAFAEWPVRFVHRAPHRDLSDFFPC